MDGNTHSDCREVGRGYMIFRISFVDSKIINMLAKLFVKIEQVRFFHNTVIYTQKISSSPFPSSTSVLAILANGRYTLESRPKGKKPTQFY